MQWKKSINEFLVKNRHVCLTFSMEKGYFYPNICHASLEKQIE